MMADVVVCALLLLSGVAAVTGALGLLRLPDFFLRMHATSLIYSLGCWSVTLASIVHFTGGAAELSLHVWLIVILLSIAAPVTTVLLARTGLFRGRQAGDTLPAPFAAGPSVERPQD